MDIPFRGSKKENACKKACLQEGPKTPEDASASSLQTAGSVRFTRRDIPPPMRNMDVGYVRAHRTRRPRLWHLTQGPLLFLLHLKHQIPL